MTKSSGAKYQIQRRVFQDEAFYKKSFRGMEEPEWSSWRVFFQSDILETSHILENALNQSKGNFDYKIEYRLVKNGYTNR